MGLLSRQYLDDPDLVICMGCKSHLSSPSSSLISNDFQGQYGRASLYRTVINLYFGSSVRKVMTTGEHVIQDAYCIGCDERIGWKYLEAMVPNQRYKVGCIILEESKTEQVKQVWTDEDGFMILRNHQSTPLSSQSLGERGRERERERERERNWINSPSSTIIDNGIIATRDGHSRLF